MNCISAYIQKQGLRVPDNNTPDTPVAVKVKRMLIEMFDLSPDAVVNEAKLLHDLDLYDLERLDLLVAWMAVFDIKSTALDEVVGPDGDGNNLMMYVRTVGEIIALTEGLTQNELKK